MQDAIRRRMLMLAASGALGAAGLSGFMARVLASGDLPKTSGIHRLEGSATVNGRDARVGTPVKAGDRIATGRASQAVVVLGKDAFLLRENTVIETRGGENALVELLISTGRVLSVFAKKPVSIKASVATIGIRGTGAYLEVDADSVYFCLCYGEAVVEGAGMPSKVVKTTHHEQPMLIRAGGGGMSADPAKFKNHTDDELILLESLVGREPPFMKDGQYPAKKY